MDPQNPELNKWLFEAITLAGLLCQVIKADAEQGEETRLPREEAEDRRHSSWKRVQHRPPQHVLLGHLNYFELKEMEAPEKVLTAPLKN